MKCVECGRETANLFDRFRRVADFLVKKYPKFTKFIGPIYVKVRQFEQNLIAARMGKQNKKLFAKFDTRGDMSSMGVEEIGTIGDSEFFNGTQIPLGTPSPEFAPPGNWGSHDFIDEAVVRKIKKESPRQSRRPRKK